VKVLGRIEKALDDGPLAAVTAATEQSGYLDMLRASQREGDDERIDNWHEDEAKVTLMTMHAAKGLEFPVVFVTGLEESVIPHSRSLNSLEELEEERRLFFVAMTRAERRLYLSYAEERMVFGEYQHNMPSRFLAEIPLELIESPPLEEASGAFAPVERQVSPRRREGKAMSRKDAAVLPVGTRVRSAKFGMGVIESVESQGKWHKATVRFTKAGKRKLILEKAHLEVIDA